MSKILVVGSSNTDMVVKSDRIPKPGETVLGGEFFSFPGGKGANQAVAAARLGGEVTFLAKVGNDNLGIAAVEELRKEGIDVSRIITASDIHSGIALILVDQKGENSISVAYGANRRFSQLDILENQDLIRNAEVILVQLEIPLEAVETVVELAQRFGKPVILNPAPAQFLSDELISKIFMLTPNETEAELLTGIPVRDLASAEQAARALHKKGAKGVIITLGAAGAFLLTKDIAELIPSSKVVAVDTTAAGDTFNGALAVALVEGMEIRDAVRFANRAAAISVTRMGAQSSLPFRGELDSN